MIDNENASYTVTQINIRMYKTTTDSADYTDVPYIQQGGLLERDPPCLFKPLFQRFF